MWPVLQLTFHDLVDGVPDGVIECTCDLSTHAPLAPAGRLLDAGVEVAIASNCNLGTSHASSTWFCAATAVLLVKSNVAGAVRAAISGGAIAWGRSNGEGLIECVARGRAPMCTCSTLLHDPPRLSAGHAVDRGGV